MFSLQSYKLSDPLSNERKIAHFPRAFKIDCTPYHKLDFCEKTYEQCLKKALVVGSNVGCKVIVLGDVFVGKTSIITRFCHKIFETQYRSTIGVDFEMYSFEVLGVPHNLQIWDTAGQERFKSIVQSYYKGAHAVILVFDSTKLESLPNCEKWLKEALATSASECIFIFLVGTKTDLLEKSLYRTVEENATKMANKLNAEYWSVSSKTGRNISDLFRRIAALTFNELVKNSSVKKCIKIGTHLVGEEEVRQIKTNCQGSKCVK